MPLCTGYTTAASRICGTKGGRRNDASTPGASRGTGNRGGARRCRWVRGTLVRRGSGAHIRRRRSGTRSPRPAAEPRRGVAGQGRAVLEDAAHVPDGTLRPALDQTGREASEAGQARTPEGFYRGAAGLVKSFGVHSGAAGGRRARRGEAARPAAAGEHRLPGAVLHVRARLRPRERDRVRPETRASRTSRRTAAGSGRRPTAARPFDDVGGHDRRAATCRRRRPTTSPSTRTTPNVVYAATGDLSFGSFAVRQRRRAEEHRRGRDVDDARRERLHACVPGRGRRLVPAVPGGGEGRASTRTRATSSSSGRRPASTSRTTAARTGPARA